MSRRTTTDKRPRLLLAVDHHPELGLGRGEPVADTEKHRRATGGDDLQRPPADRVDRLDEHPLTGDNEAAGDPWHTDIRDRRVSEPNLAGPTATELGDLSVGSTSDSVPCGAGNVTAARPSTTCAASIRRTVPMALTAGHWQPCRYRRRRPILII